MFKQCPYLFFLKCNTALIKCEECNTYKEHNKIGQDLRKNKKCGNCKYWKKFSRGWGKCLHESFDINGENSSVGFLAIMKRRWGRDCKYWRRD